MKRAAVQDPAERVVTSPCNGDDASAFRNHDPLGAREPPVSGLCSRGPRPRVPTHHPVTSLPPKQGSLPACRARLLPGGLRTRWTTIRNFLNHRMIHSFPTSLAWSHRGRGRGRSGSGSFTTTTTTTKMRATAAFCVYRPSQRQREEDERDDSRPVVVVVVVVVVLVIDSGSGPTTTTTTITVRPGKAGRKGMNHAVIQEISNCRPAGAKPARQEPSPAGR